MKIALSFAALTLLAAAPAALADTIRVPGPGIPTIQDAVDWALPGDVILVGPGEYADPVAIFDRTGIEIRGAGWPVLTAGGGFSISQSSGIVLRGLDFDDANVSATDSDDVSLVGLRFHDRSAPAVFISNCDGMLVSRCRFRDLGASGVEGVEATGLVVERCRFEDLGGVALFLSNTPLGSDGVVFSRNRVLRASGGIWCNGEDLVVEDNRMEGLASAGIDSANAGNDARGTFRRNRIQTAVGYAILNDGSDSIVERNTIVGGGIFLSSQNGVVRGNRVTDASEQAIYVNQTGIVEANQVRGAAAEGIVVLGDGSAVVGNSTTGTGGAGVQVGASNCRVSKNRVAGAAQVGFLVDGTGNLVTENRAKGSGTVDLGDTASEGANIYDGNRFGTVDFDFVP